MDILMWSLIWWGLKITFQTFDTSLKHLKVRVFPQLISSYRFILHNFLFLIKGKSTLCHHRQDLTQTRTTGVRFQLEHNPIEPIIIHRAESQIVETEIKFQMKQAYVIKGGKKQLKNVLVISETESGKLKIGWSQRRSENTSNNTRRVSV